LGVAGNKMTRRAGVARREETLSGNTELGKMLNKIPKKDGRSGTDVGMAWNATMA
jgi:hypothetical protein